MDLSGVFQCLYELSLDSQLYWIINLVEYELQLFVYWILNFLSVDFYWNISSVFLQAVYDIK
jgi:hypothetical protein